MKENVGVQIAPGAWWVESWGQVIIYPCVVRASMMSYHVKDSETAVALLKATDEDLATMTAFAVVHQQVGNHVESLESWKCEHGGKGPHWHFQERKG